jgi:hypothetical protein
MTDERIDLSPLDADAQKLEALVQAVNARCAHVLAERRARRTTIQIAGWWQPAIAAALLIAMISTLVLARQPEPEPQPQRLIASAATPSTAQLALRIGVPRLLARSLTSDKPPSADDLLREMIR